MVHGAGDARPTVHHGPPVPAVVRVLFVLAGLGLLAYSLWLVWGPDDFLKARDAALYGALFLPAIVALLLRMGVWDATRWAWGLFSAAAIVWWIAELGDIHLDSSHPAGPIVSQVLFLLTWPLTYGALILLIRHVLPDAARGTWLDGLIVMLAVTSALSLLGPHVTDLADVWPDLALVVAYPGLDLAQVTLIIVTMVVLGRSTGSAWWLLLAGSVMVWLGDSWWLLSITSGQAGVGLPDVTWPLGITLMAAAAWRPLTRGPAVAHLRWPLLVAITAGAFAIILYATLRPVPPVTVALAAGAVLVGATRSTDAFRVASARNQAQRQAHTDDLTGLANRRGLVRMAGARITESQALLLVDIDHFKQINDTLGHQAGDDVLQEVGNRFRRAAAHGALISRMGGDEFAILLPSASNWNDALTLAEALHRAMADPVLTGGLELQVELSIGVARGPEHGSTLSALLLSADRAMYRAKRDRVPTQVFDPRWDAGDSASLLVLQELRRALERGEFVCYFQPQLDVLTNQVSSVESLVRWQHPQRGIIPAGQFLPTIEQTSLIRPLSDAILDMSLGQLRAWLDEGLSLDLSVNISATNLLDRALPLRVTELLVRHQIEAGRVTLEITETALSGDEERVRVVLAQLHEIGVRISIDDYGSGYSSLQQIGTLGAHELKLDRQFVTGVGDRGDLRSILAATVHLAHGLRLRMVAEGVESASDLDQVRLSGCDMAQGFYICPPRPGDVLAAWLRERQTRTGEQRLRF